MGSDLDVAALRYDECGGLTMRRVAVIGVGVTKFGKHERTSGELFAEAAVDALADAELRPGAIQALYYGNVVGGETEHQLHTGPQAASILGIPTVPTTRFEAACASSHAAFRHAVMEIAAGISDVVLVGGGERVLNVPTADSTAYFAYASDASWEQPLGLTFPGVFALVARAHMTKYGTTEAQMAAVAVKNHKHGTLNPKAQFQKEITLDTVLKSPYIADPLKLYDCCPFTDGGAAVVLASEEFARGRRRAVWVLGSAAASDSMLLGDKRDLSRVMATERAAKAAYQQAGKNPSDVDVAELHDCFTIAEIVATEGLGFFEPGTGGLAAEQGLTSLGGKIPVNTSGGLKAKGHPIGATGAAQIAEIVTQLRGEAGPRQVDGASTGLTHTLGGNAATVLVSLFGRE
jgi:acetyl-CoA C-acetyltransferase